jgi:hypothetical protein
MAVDITVEADRATLTRVWMGDARFEDAGVGVSQHDRPSRRPLSLAVIASLTSRPERPTCSGKAGDGFLP